MSVHIHRPVRVKTRRHYSPGWHLNLDWTLEDMAFIEAEAAKGVRPKEIAVTFGVSTPEIVALMERNRIRVRAFMAGKDGE